MYLEPSKAADMGVTVSQTTSLASLLEKARSLESAEIIISVFLLVLFIIIKIRRVEQFIAS